ncbi:ABC transporter permease subunit, partial [Lacticaseibacillus paracasei]
ALPNILMGVRYALGVMWTTLIVAETISSSSGLGYMATNAQEFMRMDTVLLCILIYALLGKVSDLIAKSLERVFLSWRQGGVEA